MAQKRMFSLAVVDTDKFTDMTPSAQALYFHLGMHGDDDGFVSAPRKIVRAIGCSGNDLDELEREGYIIPFESGVIVVTDWKRNNTLKNDRYHETPYLAERAQLTVDQTGKYRRNPGMDPSWIQNRSKLEPEPNITEPNRTEPNLTEFNQGKAEPAEVEKVALKDVKAYAEELGAEVKTAEAFFDYYAARGWMISGQPVRSWKALFRSWVRRGQDKTMAGAPAPYVYDDSCSEEDSL